MIFPQMWHVECEIMDFYCLIHELMTSMVQKMHLCAQLVITYTIMTYFSEKTRKLTLFFKIHVPKLSKPLNDQFFSSSKIP